MAVQRFSASMEWSVWMYQLLVWVPCVVHVPMGTLGMRQSVMVSLYNPL